MRFFKVIVRVGVNNSNILIGEISSYMPSLAPVCDERTEATCKIHLRRLAAGFHLRSSLRRLYHRQLH